MALADELIRLEQLRDRGSLTEEEFARAKARALETPSAGEAGTVLLNGLRRSRSDRWIGGVCGGLAKLLGVDAWILRLVFALLLVFGGTGLILYVLMWIFVPSE